MDASDSLGAKLDRGRNTMEDADVTDQLVLGRPDMKQDAGVLLMFSLVHAVC